MRAPLETKTLATGYPLNAGLNQILRLLPIGELWERIHLTFHYAITHGTGAGIVLNGQFGIIKGVNLKSDKNEVMYDNVPGLGLYPLTWRQNRIEPPSDIIVAATATYDATVELPFGFSWLTRPEDFYINSRRYKTVELTITLGTIADLLLHPGTDTLITTVDISLVRSTANLWAPNDRSMNLSLPHKIPYVKHMPVLDPTAVAYWDLESNDEFYITDFIMSSGQTTGVPGVPYSGAPSDTIDGVTFKDNIHTFLDAVPFKFFTTLRQKYLGADLPGAYVYSFIPNGSYKEAYKTKNKSSLQLSWAAATGAAVATNDLVLIGYRNPRP
jgi:hypothetical protein